MFVNKQISSVITFFLIQQFTLILVSAQVQNNNFPTLFPKNKSVNVNPDTHLKLTFNCKLTSGNKGTIRIYDASNDSLVDLLDLSIPPGPIESVDHKGSPPPYISIPYKYESTNYTNANTKAGTPSGGAMPNPDNYQLNIIGRFTDAFHFFPVIIHDLTTTIYLHNNMLQYGKTYFVQIDSGVIVTENSGFKGVKGKSAWIFSTKKEAPSYEKDTFIVSTDGSGDFNTVQGAVDFIPDFSKKRYTIFIKNGIYEEIVYFRNKSNITFFGEDREKTIICYYNNEVFNPHPINISTNEWPGTFPSRRAAFMVDNSQSIHLMNLTIKTTAKGQAEGLLIMGKENVVSNCNIIGSGDALQTNGSVYLKDCLIEGDGDTYLGRGPAFFDNCTFRSKWTFAWIRNTEKNHGIVFNHCELIGTGDNPTEIARAPENHGRTYPFCEAILLNCRLLNISLVGWGQIGGDPKNVHFWEYNSINLLDGKPAGVSDRHPDSRQLTLEKDSEIIKNYGNPEFVLGWKPEIIK